MSTIQYRSPDLKTGRQYATEKEKQNIRKIVFDGQLEVTIPVLVKNPLSKNDIFDWLSACENPETLKYLGNAALRFADARKIDQQGQDDDDFRSRA